ncbi:MAG: hypothetical protein SXQ77_11900, partial [Halobacteria archaeon]|nr:hypothetical protein [Halobacteria archaeon]
QRMYEAVRARAVIHGRDYTVPDDVKMLAPAVLSHRLVLNTNAKVNSVSKREIIEGILEELPTPTNARGRSWEQDDETKSGTEDGNEGDDENKREGEEQTSESTTTD